MANVISSVETVQERLLAAWQTQQASAKTRQQAAQTETSATTSFRTLFSGKAASTTLPAAAQPAPKAVATALPVKQPAPAAVAALPAAQPVPADVAATPAKQPAPAVAAPVPATQPATAAVATVLPTAQAAPAVAAALPAAKPAPAVVAAVLRATQPAAPVVVATAIPTAQPAAPVVVAAALPATQPAPVVVAAAIPATQQPATTAADSSGDDTPPTAQSVFGANPWVTDPTGTDPDGNSYGYNPLYFATASTAAQVAQMVGGTVVASDQLADAGGYVQSQPNEMVKLANGALINPGLVASFYTHGYSQSAVTQMIANEVAGSVAV